MSFEAIARGNYTMPPGMRHYFLGRIRFSSFVLLPPMVYWYRSHTGTYSSRADVSRLIRVAKCAARPFYLLPPIASVIADLKSATNGTRLRQGVMVYSQQKKVRISRKSRRKGK